MIGIIATGMKHCWKNSTLAGVSAALARHNTNVLKKEMGIVANLVAMSVPRRRERKSSERVVNVRQS